MEDILTQEDIEKIVERLRRLHAAVDNIIALMKPDDFRGAINWGDLGCRDALIGVNEDGRLCYRVLVEEAAPGESEFCAHIERELAKRDWPNVEVRTEW